MSATTTPLLTPAVVPQLPIPIANPAAPTLPSLWPQVQTPPLRAVDPVLGLEHADVLEIGRKTTPTDAKEKLDRLKQAYSIFFANSNNNQQQFGLRQQAVNPNPIFAGTQDGDDDAYDLSEGGYDQQVLADQQRPVFVSHPGAVSVLPPTKAEAKKAAIAPKAVEPKPAPTTPTPEPQVEVKTVYISGRVPGEYTTSLTTITKSAEASPDNGDALRTPRRAKRYVVDDIVPTQVIPIASTVPPDFMDEDVGEILSSLLIPGGAWDEPVQSSLMAESNNVKTVTVTVTQCQ